MFFKNLLCWWNYPFTKRPDCFQNNSYADLEGLLAMARRAKAANLNISLDIFYTQWYFGADNYYLERRTPPRWASNFSFFSAAISVVPCLALPGGLMARYRSIDYADSHGLS